MTSLENGWNDDSCLHEAKALSTLSLLWAIWNHASSIGFDVMTECTDLSCSYTWMSWSSNDSVLAVDY